jgi:hypothetical protein
MQYNAYKSHEADCIDSNAVDKHVTIFLLGGTEG